MSEQGEDLAGLLTAAIIANGEQINAEGQAFVGPFVLELYYRPSVRKVEMVMRPTRRLPDFRMDAA